LPHVGRQPGFAQITKLDDISGSFNGSQTSFNLTSGGVAVYPIQIEAILLQIGGVWQNPGTAFTLNGNIITTTEAPTTGESFHGVVLGSGLNIGTPSDGTVTGAKLAADAVSANTKLASGVVTTHALAASAVTTAKLADSNVTTAKLADSNVTTAKLADSNVTTAKLASDAVTTAKITDANVTTAKLASDAVTTAKITDANVTTVKLADSSVTTAKLADSSVTTAKLADSNVTTAKLADSNVTTAKLADSSVTTVKLADSNVTTAKLADASVTAAKVASGAISITTASDYVQSTWTPSIEFGGGTTGLSVNQQAATAFKIGKLVFVFFDFNIISKGTSTGNAKITGLPYVANGTGLTGVGGYIEGGTTGGTKMFLNTGNTFGTAKALIYRGAGSPGTIVQDSDLSVGWCSGILLYWIS